MSIDVGDRLDKYELRERVGQGGMAVVYRGMDTSLRREVAVKVLHRHLAESQEARDRFEREAQAVAKLRHENILEIFDFSGGDSAESYIVTEFIEGQTLKQFVTEREIPFPEIGAMIALQVCRALGHAHSVGVLHRDVKPENIMIRNDGIVKLTDFGIAQMLDLQRMTVTGQLLGSPAYMAPEHVEGKGLDFRTDVFAVGIVLYQLVTGELPFKGKNPHEILKRIAECRYIDPQVVSPRVGSELARIIKKSLAREKEDRYADVTLMLAALEQFLDGSGLSDYKTELQKFFTDRDGYEKALRPRLLTTLAARGRKLLDDGGEVAALELFNRVLTIDPEHKEVLAILDRLGRRRRVSRIAMLFAGVTALAALALGARAMLGGDGDAGDDVVVRSTIADAGAVAIATADAAVVVPVGVVDATVEVASPADAGTRVRPVTNGDRRRVDAGTKLPTPRIDAGVEAAVQRTFTLVVSPRKDSEYRINNGPWKKITGSASITVPPGAVTIAARNELCCQDGETTIDAKAPGGGRININLPFVAGSITPRCDRAGVVVKIDGQLARLDKPRPIQVDAAIGSRKVTVLFSGEGGLFDEQEVEVRYRDEKVVTCKD